MAEDTPDVPDAAPAVESGTDPAELTVEQRRAARTGWYRSASGTVMHADGPDQKRALADRGWDEITEDEAKATLASGVQLVVDSRDSKGTFDADAVQRAVREEAGPDPKRSAAAKKAAATRKRNAAAAQAEADDTTAEG